MRIVIAGGSGMIGSALCDGLSAAGHDVVILTRGASRTATSGSSGRAVHWDPPSTGAWTAEIADAGAVINLAGASVGRWPWTPRRKRDLRESRLVATRALVEAIGAAPPGQRPSVLLNASGTDVYEGRDESPAGEDAHPGDSFMARLCLDWEAEARRAEASGVRVVLLRMSSVITRGAPYLRIVSLPYRLFVGGRIGSGRQWVSWVDLVDVVGLYQLALESETIDGPLNVAAPDPRQQRDYSRALAATLRRPDRVWTPAWVVRAVLRDQAALVLGSRRVWPAKALASGYTFRRARLEESLAAALRSRA